MVRKREAEVVLASRFHFKPAMIHAKACPPKAIGVNLTRLETPSSIIQRDPFLSFRSQNPRGRIRLSDGYPESIMCQYWILAWIPYKSDDLHCPGIQFYRVRFYGMT